jgi:UTP--glucose-1-phosphate uridylyltransferase
VIPAAGLGTRSLPSTKSVPKELLPVLNKPALQYIVEEAVAAGIERIVVVIRPRKQLIASHFSCDHALIADLERAGKHNLARSLRRIPDLVEMEFVEQPQPRGLGDAVLCAARQIRDESFAVLLGDDLLLDDGALLRRMLMTHAASNGVVLALREVAQEEISQYGCAAVSGSWPARVHALVEKPDPEVAPSSFAIFGRYVITPDVVAALEQTAPGRNGEIQLTDALARVANDTAVYAHLCGTDYYDLGTRLGALRANIDVALADPDLGESVARYLAERAGLVVASALTAGH